MPIYEYKCEGCSHTLEMIQKMADAPLRDCPACGAARLKRLVSAAGFQLKGTGWYATDFKDGGKKKDKDKKPKTEQTTGTPGDTPAPKKAHGCGSGGCGCG